MHKYKKWDSHNYFVETILQKDLSLLKYTFAQSDRNTRFLSYLLSVQATSKKATSEN